MSSSQLIELNLYRLRHSGKPMLKFCSTMTIGYPGVNPSLLGDIAWIRYRDSSGRVKSMIDGCPSVSGKCSVSWSSHLLVGSVALLMLCFGLSFCAARHKPTNSHTDPLRIWQSRYSQSIHAYASPKTTTTLSIVTVCWSCCCCLLRACDARVSTSDSLISIVHRPWSTMGWCEAERAFIITHINTSCIRARLCALRHSRAACPPRVYRAYHIYFSILGCECADSCTISHQFNAWLTQTQALPTWPATCPSTLTNLILRATVGVVGVFCKRVVSHYYHTLATLTGWLIIQTKE